MLLGTLCPTEENSLISVNTNTMVQEWCHCETSVDSRAVQMLVLRLWRNAVADVSTKAPDCACSRCRCATAAAAASFVAVPNPHKLAQHRHTCTAGAQLCFY